MSALNNSKEPINMGSNRAACTIIAKNYLAFARSLAQSFLALHTDHRFFVLIVDDYEGFVNPSEECFDVINISDLAIEDLPSFCFKYNITEVCTGVKADFLNYLIRERSIDKLLYIDPDILVTNNLGGLFERLDTYDIVVTPHLDTDYPDDDKLPDDSYILRAGIFNLGFIGVNASENAHTFLNWWKGKLYSKCLTHMTNGYFVDQRFVDLVPALFDNFYIEKDVGYNVAYWNLHSRHLSSENGSWRCNNGPLYFFHFSGYDPEGENAIVTPKYIPASMSRHRLSDRPDLQPIFAKYRRMLMTNGYATARAWPYSFGYFKTGEPVPNELRIVYRNSPASWEAYGDPFESRQLEHSAVIMRMRKRKALSPLITLGLKCKSWLRRIGAVLHAGQGRGFRSS
jgi:hypothetical protein